MKKTLTIFAILLAVVMAGAIVANAAEEVIQTTVESRTDAIDKNGNSYVRMICKFKRSLNGVEYEVSLPVLAFGDKVAAVANIAEGSSLKAVAQNRVLPDGRESYTIIAVIE